MIVAIAYSCSWSQRGADAHSKMYLAIRTTYLLLLAHCRMRSLDRELIRGGHYGQRSYEPHKQAEHMAAL
jgi:hypothetical protein